MDYDYDACRREYCLASISPPFLSVMHTPLHTVKPYIPYDIIPSSYKLPMATAANGSKLPARDLVVPEWIVGAISGLIYDPSMIHL